MTSRAKLKQIQELAERTRRAELAMAEANLRDPNRALSYRLQQLRAQELAKLNMTEGEWVEYWKFQQEMDKDLDDYNTGANSGDWTK